MRSTHGQTRTIAVQTTPSLAALSSTELAELVALERLTLGTVHALHNAFTTVLGEASFLESKSKGDLEFVEACQMIRAEIDRCTRVTRALQMRWSDPAVASPESADLARIVRDLSGLLTATLTSRHALRVEAPEELLLVRGRAPAIELLVILMVYQAAALAPCVAELTLRAIDDAERGRHGVSVELRSNDLAQDPPPASRVPSDDRAAALPALALRHLASELDAELETERAAYALTLRYFLPAFQGEALGAG